MIEMILGGLGAVVDGLATGAAAGSEILAAENLGQMMTGLAEITGDFASGAELAGTVGEVAAGSKTGFEALSGSIGSQIGASMGDAGGPLSDFTSSIGKSAGESLATPNKVAQTFGQVATGSPEIDSAFQGAVDYLSDPTTHMTSSQFSEVQNNLAGKSYDMTGGALEKATQADKSFGKFVSETMPNGNYNITRELTPYEQVVYQGPEKAKDALKYAAGQKIKKEVGKAFTPNKVAQAQGRGYEDGQRGSGVQQAQRLEFNMYDNYYKQVGGIR